MSLRADVQAARPQKPPCLYQRVRAALSVEDRADLDEMLADPITYPAPAIVAGLAKQNVKLGTTTIFKHRRGGCTSCR